MMEIHVRLKLINLICIFRYLHLQDNMDPAMEKSDKLWRLLRGSWTSSWLDSRHYCI